MSRSLIGLQVHTYRNNQNKIAIVAIRPNSDDDFLSRSYICAYLHYAQ
jgi:hypothetical protein